MFPRASVFPSFAVATMCAIASSQRNPATRSHSAQGARLGTSSLPSGANASAHVPISTSANSRGNVDTRLRKVEKR